jgi:acetyl esterase/lipase
MRKVGKALGLVVLLLGGVGVAAGAEPADAVRTRDVIYGRRSGLALTMDVFAPPKGANGLGVIAVVSGGWRSGPEMMLPAFYEEFLKRGYTVFAVVHGSQPKFTLPEIIDDMQRSVRYIRSHARDYHIDPDRLAAVGGSSGGHLALLLGTAGGPGDPKAADPVDRASSKVQAVAAFFPPTDYLNYGAEGKELIDRALDHRFVAAVDYHTFDKARGMFVPVTDKKELREITRRISPASHVDKDSAPTLLIHGDKDDLVPLQQSEWMRDKFKKAGVPVELIVKEGAGHGWPTILGDMKACADWFDKRLGRKGGDE